MRPRANELRLVFQYGGGDVTTERRMVSSSQGTVMSSEYFSAIIIPGFQFGKLTEQKKFEGASVGRAKKCLSKLTT